MLNRLSRALAAALPALGLFAAAPSAQAADAVSVNFTGGHAYFGVGAQIEIGLELPQQEGALLQKWGAQYVRLSAMPDLTGNIPTGLSVSGYAQLLPKLVPSYLPADEAKLKTFLQANHLKPHLVFWHMPQAWLTPLSGTGADGQSLWAANTARLQDYANLLTAEVQWLGTQGITPFAIELTNEPQGGWDTKFTPAQYAQLVLLTSQAFKANGLGTVALEGPGTDVEASQDYINALQQSHAISDLAYMSAHDYDTVPTIAAGTSPGYSSFLGQGKIAPVVVTEFGNKDYAAASAQAGESLNVNTSNYGLQAGAMALELLGRGAGSLSYWNLVDAAGNDKVHGALDPSGQPRPVAYAMQALFGGLPTTATTAAGTGGDANVIVQGFTTSAGKTWLLVANLSSNAETVSVKLTGAKVKSVSSIQGYSNSVLNAHVITGGSVSGTTFTGTIAAQSLASVALQ